MTTPTRKIHIIFNAHLDPIWLWSWRDGLDEVLNTCYYICNLLDRHPDIIYTRGEAWVYEQVQRIDPALFERIRAHVKAGRWSIVGGWYIQPDCNAPSGFALERQVSLGQKFFREHFGAVPSVGYNVDSFGHAATLPGYMHSAGQSSYVMMRPQEHELNLPARLFRWRGYADGPEVATFRIANAYCTPAGLREEHIHAAASELPDGVSHAMCFIGVGDHGGGPTEEMIDWCREHRTKLDGLELVFSSPEKFFAAIQPEMARLPLVVGELQMHAVGCYTVHRPVKLALRNAEHRLVQAETALKKFPHASPDFAHEMEIAWKQVCFHQFHDTLGGTCLPTAYADIHAQLGRALAIADEAGAIALRRHLVGLPNDPAQRLAFFNASDFAFSDFVEIEPWLEWSKWQPGWQLIDEKNNPVPCQLIDAESQADCQARLLFSLNAAPGELKLLRILDGKNSALAQKSALTTTSSSLRMANGPAIDLDKAALELPPLGSFPLPQLSTYEDQTDTWSHGIDRYARKNAQAATWQKPILIDKGPLMASIIQAGAIGSSQLQAEWRLYHGQPWVECLLRVTWMEKRRVLKLEWNLPSAAAEREDGILGGSLIRPCDGRELPLRDWTLLRLAAANLAVVAPEVYAIDAEPNRLGFTLLRSPYMAWHDPNPGTHPRGIHSDRGEHHFRFRFIASTDLSPAALDQMSFALQRPLLTADFTRGMKTRALRQSYAPPAAP